MFTKAHEYSFAVVDLLRHTLRLVLCLISRFNCISSWILANVNQARPEEVLVHQKPYYLPVGERSFIMVPPSRPLRRGRGNRTAHENRFQNITRSALRSVHAITTVSDSSSSVKNVKRSRKVVADYVNRVNGSEPEIVTYETSKLIIKLLSTYCKTITKDPLSDESIGTCVWRIKFFYDEIGHRGPWTVDKDLRTAKWNPLYRNPDIDKLRFAHRFRLAKVGKAEIRPRPLQVGHVADHAKQFWLGSNNLRGYRDVLLHATMVVGLNQGLR